MTSLDEDWKLPAAVQPDPHDYAYDLDRALSSVVGLSARVPVYGWHERRNPSADFNTNYYESHNPDGAAAGIDPLLHYDQLGWHEGRDPAAVFSTNGYLTSYTDVATAASIRC